MPNVSDAAPLCSLCGERCMEYLECDACGGSGKVQDTRDWSLGGLIYMEMRCPTCLGRRYAWEPTCVDDYEDD